MSDKARPSTDSFDWENPFKPEDFNSICTCARAERKREHLEHMSHCAAYDAPEIANARFRELVKEHGRRVWIDSDIGVKSDYWTENRSGIDSPPFTAILIYEKPLKD